MTESVDIRNQTLSRAVSGEVLQLVSFKIGNEEFGVDILKVQEIIRMAEVTRFPGSPLCVDGVINLRGRLIPILNLRDRLGAGRKTHDKETRIVVVEASGNVIGFVVDAVNEVLRIPKSLTEAPPPGAASINAEYITAVGKLDDRLVILLNLEKILTREVTTDVCTA